MAHDDGVANEEALWRSIIDQWIKTDPTTGQQRISSAAFKDGQNEISVHRARLTTRDFVLARRPNLVIAEILAGRVRELGHQVAADPTEQDVSHALILPSQPHTTGRIKKIASELASIAILLG